MAGPKSRRAHGTFRTSLKVTPLDLILLVLMAGLTMWITLLTFGWNTGTARLRVESAGKTFLFTLDKDRTLEFEGPLGATTIVIQDGSARFLDSPCRDKLCVASGHLHSPGSWSACLPNQVIARVEGSQGDGDEGPDSVSW